MSKGTVSEVHAFTPPPEDPARAGGILTIDLGQVVANWRHLKEKAASAICAAVVKADAYGLGAVPVAQALFDAGCRHFFVALPQEGAHLRAALGAEAKIWVLNGLLPGEAAFYADHGLRPVLSSLPEVTEWAAFCRMREMRLPAAVHVDTGMNRLGLNLDEAHRLADDRDLLGACRLELVMSHLACADEPGDPMNERQRETFAEIRALFPDVPASLANSAGTLIGSAYHFDMVRPGIALYGGNPFCDRPNPMRAVVSLYAPVLMVRRLRKGETVGYGTTWRAERPSRVAVLGLGYADGYLRSLSWPARNGPAQVMIGGHYAPVIGRVSMDSICVDVTDVPEDFVERGVRAEVLGPNVTVDEVAKWAGTISYEILTSLGGRYTRLYVPAGNGARS